MKAAIVEAPDKVTVRQIAEPAISPYAARCEMLFGAVCTGTDNHLVKGKFPFPVQYPTILGHEAIGRVVELGPKVRHFKIGDVITRVGTPAQIENGLDANWGGFAEVGLAYDHLAMQEDGLPESEWQQHRVNQILPADIDPAAATMVITWRETFSFITRMGVTAGSRVLVLGTGGNGLAFVAHAANLGASAIAVVGSQARESVARTLGATAFSDYKGFDASVAAAEFGEGFDFIIDAVGKSGQLNGALPLVADGGSVSIYGLDDWGALTIDPTRARGSFTYANKGYAEFEVHDQIIGFMRSGKLNARHWINLDNPFPLSDIQKAFDALERRELVKAVISLRP